MMYLIILWGIMYLLSFVYTSYVIFSDASVSFFINLLQVCKASIVLIFWPIWVFLNIYDDFFDKEEIFYKLK